MSTHAHPHVHDHPHDHHHAHGGGSVWHRLSHVVRPHSHDSVDSIDSELEGSAAGIRAVKISLVALLVTAALQAVVVAFSGSVGLLADTIHNVSDAMTALPLWLAFTLVRRPASRRFTYGYGRAEDLAGLVIVLVITLSAVLAGYESIDRLLHPRPLEGLGWVMAAGVIGFLGNEFVAMYRIRVGRQIGSAALVADGLHARTDGFTSLAVVLGAIGVMLGFPLADPIIGLLITLAIVMVLRGAVVDIFRRLMDGIDPSLLAVAESALRETSGVRSIEYLRMRWIGHLIRVEAGVAVDPRLDVGTGRQIAERARACLTQCVPHLGDVSVALLPGGTAVRREGDEYSRAASGATTRR